MKRFQGVRGNERIHALTDDVFSIIITLLVFQIGIPEAPPGQTAASLPQTLLALQPKFESLVMSFVVIGLYWVGHHIMFMHIKRHDRNLLWINIFFLMCVALIPFTTSLLQHYADQQLALVIYYGLLIFIGLVAEAMWNYATGGHRLTEPNLDPALVKSMHRRLLLAPAIYLLAIVITFVNVTAAKWIILGVALIYIAPSAVDYYHYRHLNPTDQAEPPAQETHT